MSASRTSVFVATVCLFVTANVHAQTPPSPPPGQTGSVKVDPKKAADAKAAEAAFNKGVRLIEQQQYAAAAAQFEVVVAKFPTAAAAWNNLSFAYRRLGNFQKAEAAAKKALALTPKDPGPLRSLADICLTQKRFDDAKRYLSRLAALEPRNPAVPLTLGQIEAQSGNLPAAERHFRAAARLSPDDPNIRRSLIALYLALKKPADVLREQRELARLLPNDARAQFDLGIRLAQANRNKEALAAFEKAASLDPSNDLAVRNIARLQTQAGQTAAAVATYRKILAKDKYDPEANFALGMEAYAKKAWPAAEQYFRNVASRAKGPQQISARINLGLSLANQPGEEKAAEARSQFEKVLETDKRNSIAYAQLAALQSRAGQWRDAAATYRRWTEADPKNPEAFSALGMAAMFSGDRDTQLYAYQRLYALKPDDASRASLAQAYVSRQAVDQAVQLYRPLLKKTPKYRDDIARLYSQAGRPEDAIKELEEWTKADPKNPDAWESLGNSLREQSRFDDARKAYAAMKPLAPKIASPYVRIAETWTREGKREEALKELDSAPKDAKDIASAYRLMGSTLETENKLVEAADAYRKAAAADKNDVYSAGNVPRLLMRADRKDEAIKEYEALVKKYPKDANMQQDYAEALEKKGDKAAALAAYRKVGTLKPMDAAWARNAARLLDELGNTTEAIAMLKDVITKDVSDSLAGADYVRLSEKAGKLDEATAFIISLVDKQPETAAPYRLLVSAYTTRDQRSGAKVEMDGSAPASGIEVLKSYAARYPNSDIPLQHLLNYAKSRGHLKVAAEAARQLAERQPNNTTLELQWADTLEQAQDTTGAVAVLETIVKREPYNAQVHRRLARLYEAQGRPVDARAEYEIAGRYSPEDPDVTKGLARLPAPVGMATPRPPTRPPVAPAGPIPAGLDGLRTAPIRLDPPIRTPIY
jgi:tetratricopeptide (TPR) repeat protein